MEVASDITSRHTRCRYMRNNKTALLITAQALPVFLSVTLLKQTVLQRLLSTDILLFQLIPPYLTYALYPISTSLLTILFRRYSVIRGSLWVICVATFGTVAVLLVDYISELPAVYTYSESKPVPSTCTYITVLLVLAYVLLSVGLGGFHSNIIAFGYEQMKSAGAKELVTFIHLCLGLEYLGFGMAFAYAAVTNNGQYVDDVIAVNLYVSLGCAAMVTIVMVLTLLCQDRMVIEEPNHPNPLKLIFKVAWYSKKVHSFHHTTTLTQGSPLAVMPFTTREVDDVKTFFRFLPIFIPLGLLIVANVAATRTAPSILGRIFFFNFTNQSDTISSLLVGSYSVPYLIIPPFILMYNFVLTHVFYRRFVTILNRVTIGMILMALVLLTVVVTVAVLYSTTVHMRFIILYMALSGLSGISLFLVVSAVFEFICAQSPYSMRSMMISITYATEGLGSVVGIALLLAILDPHHASATRQSWHYRPIVYYSVSAAMAVVGVVIAIFNAKRHKARRRLDKKYEDAYADRVSILSSLMSSIENFEIINQPAASYS